MMQRVILKMRSSDLLSAARRGLYNLDRRRTYDIVD